MRKFEKVSYEQFNNDIKKELYFDDILSDQAYRNITLPRRATSKSAGYDLVSPIDFILNPNNEIKVPTGIKCNLDDLDFLLLAPRSGHGFKYYVRLANTIGIGDADYYNNKGNEGHYWVKIRNEGDIQMSVKAGEAFCQAIILPFSITIDDNPRENDRVGGLGSTN